MTLLLRSKTSNRFVIICHLSNHEFERKQYENRGGIRLKLDLKNEIEEKKNPLNEQDPFKYNFYGGRSLRNMFFYTNRTAGKGYTDYANSFPNRPYVWPPFRRVFKILNFIVILFLIPLCVDFEWLVFHIIYLKDF